MKRISYCKVNECGRRCHGHGYCLKHYDKWRKYGNPLGGVNVMPTGTTADEKFWSRVALTADDSRCWEWLGSTSTSGYGMLRIKRKAVMAHRYAWFLVKGSMPSGILLHSCDNPPCVNPNHLQDGTQADNIADMMFKGRSVSGHIFTADEVRYVLALLADGYSPFRIANQTGFHRHSITKIKHGTHWSIRLLNGGQTPSQPLQT